MNLVESHIVKSSPEFLDICSKTKNLYNKINYIIRQEFIDNGNYISRFTLTIICKDLPEYKALPARVARGVIRILDGNWKSFFCTIKDWKKNPYKYISRPKLPKYLPKNKLYFTSIFTDSAILIKDLKRDGIIGLSGLNYKFKLQHKNNRLIEVQLVPFYNKFKINIIYETKEKIEFKEDNKKYCAIDLGVNNLVTITSNDKNIKPLIINGRPIKSINQFYNKKESEIKSMLKTVNNTNKSKKLNQLSLWRYNKINDYFHKTSRYIVDFCKKNEINTIIIGHNPFWKQKTKMSKQSNQKFIEIPFDKLIKMLQYKGLLEGIKIIFQEESYTSKANFLNLDKIPLYGSEGNNVEFSGYRKCRGLYKTKNSSVVINADVNGSYNILRKAVPEAFVDGIEGVAVYPSVVTIGCAE